MIGSTLPIVLPPVALPALLPGEAAEFVLPEAKRPVIKAGPVAVAPEGPVVASAIPQEVEVETPTAAEALNIEAPIALAIALFNLNAARPDLIARTATMPEPEATTAANSSPPLVGAVAGQPQVQIDAPERPHTNARAYSPPAPARATNPAQRAGEEALQQPKGDYFGEARHEPAAVDGLPTLPRAETAMPIALPAIAPPVGEAFPTPLPGPQAILRTVAVFPDGLPLPTPVAPETRVQVEAESVPPLPVTGPVPIDESATAFVLFDQNTALPTIARTIQPQANKKASGPAAGQSVAVEVDPVEWSIDPLRGASIERADGPGVLLDTGPRQIANIAQPARANDAEIPGGTAQLVASAIADQAIDAIAREIAQVAANEGRAAFRIAADTLGNLDVRIERGDSGLSVGIRTESDESHAIVAGAQQRLAEDLRGNGLKLGETSVSTDPRSPDRERHEPRAAPYRPIETAAPDAQPANSTAKPASGRFA